MISFFRFNLFIFVLIVVLTTNLFGNEIIEEIDLNDICLTKIEKIKSNYICSICPDFTDFAGEDYDKFIITNVIKITDSLEKSVYYISYFGCEPRDRFYGGYVFYVKDKINNTQNLIVDENRQYLGKCKKIPVGKKIFLKCSGNDKYHGRSKSWNALCEIKDLTIKCNK